MDTTTTTTCSNTVNGSDPQKCTANSQAQQNNYGSSSIMKDYGGERENSDSPQSPIGGATKKTATTMPLSSTWSIYWKEFQEQLHTSLPTWCGMLLYKFPWLVSLRFVGALGAQELAAAALATTLCNVTGLSLSVGLSSAMTTLAGQARGDLLRNETAYTRASASSPNEMSTIQPKQGKTTKEDTQPLLLSSTKNGPNGGATTNYTSTCDLDTRSDDDDDDAPPKVLLPMVFLYRGIFIQLLFVIPMGLWWISGIQQFLLHLGQEETLAAMTEVYLRILTPGLWSYSLNFTLTTWLQTMEMANVPAYAAAVGMILHVPCNIFFMYTLGWGYLGAAMATVVFQLIQPALMFIYLFGTVAGQARVLRNTGAAAIGRTCLSSGFLADFQLAVSSMQGIRTYLGLAIPGIIVISEWWASELSIFLSGRLTPSPEVALGGMTLYQSLNTFCFMFPVGCAVAGSTRIGNLLGAGDANGAKVAAKVSVLSAAWVSLALGCILYFTPHSFFPSLFQAEEAVVQETGRTIPLLATYVFADGIQVALNGIIKGCGRQCVTVPIVGVAYWLCGVPLAYYFAFVRNNGTMCRDDILCGDVGLVAGMTIGTWVHMILLAMAVVGMIHWEAEAGRARERVAGEKSHDQQQKKQKPTDVQLRNSLDIIDVDEFSQL